MPSEATQARWMKTVQTLASYIGLGLVHIEDPDYIELCEKHRALSLAYRRGDFTSVLTSLDRDYELFRPDGQRCKRREIEGQLRHRFENQVQSDYREEPAHVVIRGKRAKVATRIYGKTIVRRDGKLVELQERGESLTLWIKSRSGWKRARTQVRMYEQNTEWLVLADDATLAVNRSEKFSK